MNMSGMTTTMTPTPKVAAMNETTKVSARDVQVYYGDKHAIKDVNIEIRPRTVTAFIGPSGCGKSTFLRCINRMNDTIASCRVEGLISIDSENIYDPKVDPVQLRAKVGMVFQKPNPFPKSIFENVAYGPRIHGLAAKKSDLDDIVASALQKAGLWNEVKDRLDSPGTGLSGGQQQRLCIARAVAVSPEVILMDEPWSALDPIATAKVEELIHELRENFTIVIVTHSMQQAARVSQRTAMFHLGNLVEDDVLGDHLLGEPGVGIDERANRVGHHLLGRATHFRDAAGQVLQFLVVDRDDMGR